MRQEWHDLLFAHWPVPAEMVAALLPAGLPLDTYGGQAWIGVVPFRMAGVRPRGVMSLPWISAFPELNVRTYVTLEDKPGVYFFSLDAANSAAVWLARFLFALPYFRARMRCTRAGDAVTYTSVRAHRRAPAATLDWSYRPIGAPYAATPGSLERWLTERYCLYAGKLSRQQLFRAEIHHPQWLLQPAEAERRVSTMAEASHLRLPDMAPLLHYSSRQDVLVWPLKRLRSAP